MRNRHGSGAQETDRTILERCRASRPGLEHAWVRENIGSGATRIPIASGGRSAPISDPDRSRRLSGPRPRGCRRPTPSCAALAVVPSSRQTSIPAGAVRVAPLSCTVASSARISIPRPSSNAPSRFRTGLQRRTPGTTVRFTRRAPPSSGKRRRAPPGPTILARPSRTCLRSSDE